MSAFSSHEPVSTSLENGRPWTLRSGQLLLTVRLTPKSSADAIDGIARLADDSTVLKARVRAAPENGKANIALLRLIADTLQVAKSAVTMTSGASGRTKVIAVTGDAQAMADRLVRLFG